MIDIYKNTIILESNNTQLITNNYIHNKIILIVILLICKHFESVKLLIYISKHKDYL
jgi:hypothetical protein